MSGEKRKNDVTPDSAAPGREKGIYMKLFSTFARIGAFTFGGGWAMISLIEREVVEKRQWIPREEFLDLLAVAQSLPGILAVQNNRVVSAIFSGIRPAVVALIVAPVITSGKAARIGWKTVWIPVVAALLIWSKWPVVSNPILYVILGGLGGYLWLRRQEKRLHVAKGGRLEDDTDIEKLDEKEKEEGL